MAQRPDPIMSPPSPQDFAAAWYAAWNSHDLEAILAHYAEDVVFTSPFVVRLTGDPSGTLRGRDALRGYFGKALAKYPSLHFEPLGLYTGAHSLVLHYRSVEGLLAAETMHRDARSGHVAAVQCHYLAEG